MAAARANRQDGFSLIEVIIAVVVLSLAGLALLNGLKSTQEQAGAVNQQADTVVALNSAMGVVDALPFVSCLPNSLPYEGNAKLKKLGVAVAAAKFLVSGSWQSNSACATTLTRLPAGSEPSAIKIQLRVIAKSSPSSPGATRWVTKLNSSSSRQFSVQLGSLTANMSFAAGTQQINVTVTDPTAHPNVTFGFIADAVGSGILDLDPTASNIYPQTGANSATLTLKLLSGLSAADVVGKTFTVQITALDEPLFQTNPGLADASPGQLTVTMVA